MDRIIHKTTGAPINDESALTGKTYPSPGSWEKISHNSTNTAPQSIQQGVSKRWTEVCRSPLTMCGTAMPIKPIGPVKAVVAPVNNVAERIIIQRILRTSTPILLA